MQLEEMKLSRAYPRVAEARRHGHRLIAYFAE